MLTNSGGYFYVNPETKYRGLFFPELKDENNWTLFKTVDEIKFSRKEKAVINKYDFYERAFENGSVCYFYSNNSLILDTNIDDDAIINLDMREIYDFDDKGRMYDISFEKGCIVVEYKKYWDNILEHVHYARYLAIRTNLEFEKIMKWESVEFKEDFARKSNPWALYVFNALKLRCKKGSRLCFSFSGDKDKAIDAAARDFNLSKQLSYVPAVIKADTERRLAYNCAVKSFSDLIVEFNSKKGLYAGLPWFFQFWTRDEAVSIKAAVELEMFDFAKKILFSRLSYLDKGRIPNRIPYSGIDTADGTGWVFKRIFELILSLQEKKKPMEEYISMHDIMYVRGKLQESIDYHIKNYSEDLLIRNNAYETWMDTSWENDTRQGIRIEIQSLWLMMLKFSGFLDKMANKKEVYPLLEEKTAKKVKEGFFDGLFLKDGLNDNTLRPNAILAYYIYPELLEAKEWENVFDYSINRLWLDWGGFSTMDKESKLFCGNYSGEDNRSYHRGDSWFFINNIIATCMIKLNRKKYYNKIEKIINASKEDILFNGIIGRPSELSSASSLKAEASLFQLWSASTLIELINAAKEND